jgi:hypothetical protein
MIGSQIIKNGKKFSHSLINTLKEYCGIVLTDTNYKKLMQYHFIHHKVGQPLTKKMMEYAGDDTRFLVRLSNAIEYHIKKYNLEKIMRLEMALLPVLVKMELRGCKIDEERWRESIAKWREERDRLQLALDAELRRLGKKFPIPKKYLRDRVGSQSTQYDMFGSAKKVDAHSSMLNYASSEQIGFVFHWCGEQPTLVVDDGKKTVTEGDEALQTTIEVFFPEEVSDEQQFKESVDDIALSVYLNENPTSPLRPFISLLRDFRKVDKLVSTYGDKFLQKLENGFIHTSYTQCRTKTGRLSSHGPNLQNIPNVKEPEFGHEIREFFVPTEGNVMATSDMSGAEVAIAANYSKEKLLLDSIELDMDMHSKLASVTYSIIFKTDVQIRNSKDTLQVGHNKFTYSTLRTDHKRVLFAKFYKAGARRIYSVLGNYINIYHPVCYTS